MTKKKIIKIGLALLGIGTVTAVSIMLYFYFMPHRDVQATKTDFSLQASTIVAEYLSNEETANEKYLSEDGDSKVLEISGKVAQISEDAKGDKVILLKGVQ